MRQTNRSIFCKATNAVRCFACLLTLFPAAASELELRIEQVERSLLPASLSQAVPAPPWHILDRMRHYRVPGVSIAVIHNFQLDWAKGYGVLEAGGSTPVDNETLFQAASISKPLAALAILSLVEQGKLDLDEPVNDKLRSWRIPDNPFTAQREVTVRHLLTHMAGTTIPGYLGYGPNQPLPSLVQILTGQRPSNSPPVFVDLIPGTQFRYSGGGYTLLQLLSEDLTALPFAHWMQTSVLDKLEMNRSTFVQPLPVHFHSNAATGHLPNATPIRGRWMIHPEQAAAGLWSTPTDLARFVIELQKSYAGQSNRVLSANGMRQMLSVQAPDWGLGISLLSEGAIFLHNGSNQGFRSSLFAFTHSGDGVVVMTNSDEGQELRNEIIRAVAAVYGWPVMRVTGYPEGAPLLASAGAVRNAATHQPVAAAGSLIQIFGSDINDSSEVLVNGRPAVLIASYSDQITAVLPHSMPLGLAIVQVRRGGIASAGRGVRIAPHAPGIFTLNQQSDGPGHLLHTGGQSTVTEAEPATHGEPIGVLCTGLGETTAQPSVMVGGIPAAVLRIVDQPGSPGVQRIDIQIPVDAPRGLQVPLLIRLPGAVSNTVTLPIA